jgi:hypothetical protein
VIWADGAIRNTWLEVTVEGLLDGTVVGRDVFYFGHLAGETGDTPPGVVTFSVLPSDLFATRAAAGTRGAGLTNPYDHNRDGVVNVLDVAAGRGNLFAALPAPATNPGVAAVPATVSRDRASRYRPGAWAALRQ